MKLRPIPSHLPPLAAALAAMLASHPAQAAGIWDGDTSKFWTNAANWDSLPTSATTTALTFNTAGTAVPNQTNNDLAGTFQLNSMTFGTSMTVSGNKLDFAGTNPAVNIAAGIALVINNDLNIGTGTVFRSSVTTANTSTVEFKGLLSGATLKYANNSPAATTPALVFKFSGSQANTMNGFTMGSGTAGQAAGKVQIDMDDPFGGLGTTLNLDNTTTFNIEGLTSARSVASGITLRGNTNFTGTSMTFKGNWVTNTGGGRTLTNSLAAGQTLSLADGTGATFDISRLTFAGTGRTVINGEIVELTGTTTVGYKGIRKSGTGTLVLNGKSSMGSGVTSTHTVTGGTLQFGKQISLYNNNTSLWTADRLLVGNGSTAAFNVGGTGEFTTGDVTTLMTNLGGLGGAVNNNGLQAGASIGFDTTNAAGGVFTVANNLADSTGTGGGGIGLTKLGSNTLELSNTNTYTGATTVSAGKLLVNGTNSGAGTVTVGDGATLGGTGSITGAVIVDGILSPGASIESLGTGALTLRDGSTFAYEMDHSAGTAVGGDLLLVNGNLSLSGAVGLDLTDMALVPGAFAPNSTTLSLIQYAGNWNGGFFSYDTNVLTNGATFQDAYNNHWKITYNASAGGLNFATSMAGSHFVTLSNLTAIPEPASWLALGCLVGSGMLLRTRRCREGA